MTLGVMSDTHNNLELMDKAADLMMNRFAVAKIYHLGDDYEDSSGLLKRGVEIVRVPGIYDREYADSSLQKRIRDNVSGFELLVAHSEKILPENEIGAADVILVGHTHLHEIRDADGKVFFNPGHLRGPSDKGRAPTFGIIQIGQDSFRLTICDLGGEPVETCEVKR
jgi:putative phosphoesterase